MICLGVSPTRMKCDLGDELSHKRGSCGRIPFHPLERFAEEPVQQEGNAIWVMNIPTGDHPSK